MDPLESKFEEACERYDGRNFERLDEVDQILVAIWGLEADVNNGGFDQYYFNSSGDLAYFAPEALRRIGATTMASIVESANAVFGRDGPPRSRDARQEQLLALKTDAGGSEPWEDFDQEFCAYPDDLSDLLSNYLRGRGR